MSINIFNLALVLATCSVTAAFSTPTPDAMRAANAVQQNSKLSSSLNVTKDANGKIVSYHVNGVNPDDADILLKQDTNPLSSEYTIITGKCSDGSSCCYMLPSPVATGAVVESISKDLVNAGSTNIDITKQKTGRAKILRG